MTETTEEWEKQMKSKFSPKDIMVYNIKRHMINDEKGLYIAISCRGKEPFTAENMVNITTVDYQKVLLTLKLISSFGALEKNKKGRAWLFKVNTEKYNEFMKILKNVYDDRDKDEMTPKAIADLKKLYGGR